MKAGQRQAVGSGVKFALEDHQFIAEYIPLVSQVFWDKLSPESAEDDDGRMGAEYPDLPRQYGRRPDQGAHTLQEHGIKFSDPTAEQSAAERKQMMAEQDQMAKEIKVSPEMVKLIVAETGSGTEHDFKRVLAEGVGSYLAGGIGSRRPWWAFSVSSRW